MLSLIFLGVLNEAGRMLKLVFQSRLKKGAADPRKDTMIRLVILYIREKEKKKNI